MAQTQVEEAPATGKRLRKAKVKAAKQESGPVLKPGEINPGRKDPLPKVLGFFDRLAATPLADWGTRAKVTIYRLYPVTDATVGSQKKYIKVYTQPPVNEERIKQDCGSGRYRLYLSFKAPAQNEKEVDSIEIDILDMNFPPKVPKGAWLDDPRNAEWAWAKEAYDKQNTPQQNTGHSSDNVLDTIDKVLDVAERFKPEAPTPKSATEELQTLVAVAEKLRPPETVPQFMQAQFTSLQQQISAQQERADKLMDKLMDARTAKPADNNGLSVVKELITGFKDLLPVAKDVFPGLGEAGTARMAGWQEFATAVAPYARDILSPFAGVLAQMMLVRMQQPQQPQQHQPNPQPHHQPAAGLPAAPGSAPPTMMPFLQMIAMPMLNFARSMTPGPDSFEPAEAGENFAAWVSEGFSANPNYPQALLAAQAMGPAGIISAFRSIPIWNDKGPNGQLASLAELEQKLLPFMDAFLKYNPEQEADDEEQEESQAPVVMTYSEGVGE